VNLERAHLTVGRHNSSGAFEYPIILAASRQSVGLPDGAVLWLDTRLLRPARPGHANHIHDRAERHYTEECQPT
jgi:hypothetical protein